MSGNMRPVMREAMDLMQSGDLNAATHAIQRGLRGGEASMRAAADRPMPAERGILVEGDYRVISRAADDVVQDSGTSESARSRESDGVGGEFLVMLHGCTQSPDDFALGTRMHSLAQERGYVVAYPAQTPSNNAGKCWNWFRGRDQRRDQGEPAIIAALTRHIVESYGLDVSRVYVAGLSAGGAMAAVLASAYPDVYAAIGVHSGLPFGAAHDLPSAFAAMKQGAALRYEDESAVSAGSVPVIVFHGDRDQTVAPSNGAAVIAQRLGANPRQLRALDATRRSVETGAVPRGHRYTRTIFRNADGRVIAEQWLVHGAGHAWFGGDSGGSYTDPSGPNASEHILRFFSACSRAAIK